jgi:hypothetical protein
MEIPMELHEPIHDPLQYVHLIYGEVGVGKTTFASQIDGHYILRAEEGTKGVRHYGTSVHSWQEFKEAATALIKMKRNGFEGREIKTIVIDTIGALADMLCEYITGTQTFIDNGKASKFDNIDDVPWGKGFRRVANILVPALKKIHQEGFGLVLLAHVRDRSKKWKGQDVDVYQPYIGPGNVIPDSICALADVVGYYHIEAKEKKNPEGNIVTYDEKRVMQFAPTFQSQCKHRLRCFPASLELELDDQWQTYQEAFADCFAKEFNNG